MERDPFGPSDDNRMQQNVPSLAFLKAASSRALLAATLGLGFGVPARAQMAEQPPASVALRPDTGDVKRTPVPPLALESEFAQSQLRYDRVLGARLEARFDIKRLFRERGIRYPAAEVFLRIFKRERALEVWVRPADAETFSLLKSYDICALAGELGPKRRQGDLQVPEGFYYIDHFNPVSDYHLSLHVDYPNRSDRILGDTTSLGGDIFIHGGCNSEGCLAVTDEGIKQIYWLSVEARGAGQQRIPVHIFPARLSDAELPLLAKAFAGQPRLVAFWRSLKPGYDFFERDRVVPRMSVTESGAYRVAGIDRTLLPGPVPLGTPAGTSGPVPLGTPVNGGGAAPADALAAPAGATPGAPPAAPARKPAVDPKKPVPLGKPVGGG